MFLSLVEHQNISEIITSKIEKKNYSLIIIIFKSIFKLKHLIFIVFEFIL